MKIDSDPMLRLVPQAQKRVKTYKQNNMRRMALFKHYAETFTIDNNLSRALVSFQANKSIPFYRWLKYKEAFSSELALYFLEQFRPKSKNSIRPSVLDPFAGIGTTLTAAIKAGWKATGIELLPIGSSAIYARLLADTVSIKSFQYNLNKLKTIDLKPNRFNQLRFKHLRITNNAFSKDTEEKIAAYREYLGSISNIDVRYLFWFACLSILEEISYTRKDGQYLRWDCRSEKSLKSNFNKGEISEFKYAIVKKLNIMLEDIKQRNGGSFSRNADIIEGSSLTKLPLLKSSSFNMIITSPPYCNRYDYTRTYALELAFLDYNEKEVKDLRQELVSATVENKTKSNQMEQYYNSRNISSRYYSAVQAFKSQDALHEVLNLLQHARDKGMLNNNNIPNLVENYFFEMNLIIHEMFRVLVPDGYVVMVNDNVQYNGEEVPVDLILSDLASKAGFSVEKILILPRGKGNSSQQMGIHGRNEIRKCVYIWKKTEKQ